MNSILWLCFVVLVVISQTIGAKYDRYGKYDGYELLDSHPIDSYGSYGSKKGYYGPGDYQHGRYSSYDRGYGGLSGYGNRGYGRGYGGYRRGVDKAASRILAKIILKNLADRGYDYGGHGSNRGYGSHGGYGRYDSYDGYKK